MILPPGREWKHSQRIVRSLKMRERVLIFLEVKMSRTAKEINYFTKTERALWCASTMLILIFFFCFDREGYLTLAASLIGVTSLIFNAKGNPVGQVLMLLFCLLYGLVSYTFAYYGEMISYLGMTAPMAFLLW